MGIKNPRRVPFTFNERSLKTVEQLEAEGMTFGPDGQPRITVIIRPSQEATYAARRRLASHNRCPCCYQEIPDDWRGPR
ncbi:hypothetical protein [uncultured Deinococcus sp.]|uniref:hypothetical protein n=1 Tax=uncultured Deinococcus sp. TaxID=158789 RepID=UPI0025DA23A8|nr:hypothetical protein [uncultured Deinococcus sp.]